MNSGFGEAGLQRDLLSHIGVGIVGFGEDVLQIVELRLLERSAKPSARFQVHATVNSRSVLVVVAFESFSIAIGIGIDASLSIKAFHSLPIGLFFICSLIEMTTISRKFFSFRFVI